MGDYNRSTRELRLNDLPPEFKAALDKHIELYSLGPILDDALVCVETTSEKIKKGLFAGAGAKVVKTVDIVTPRWLVQIIKSEDDAAFARSAQLTDIAVTDYEKSEFHAMIPDTGVNVSGRFTDAPENSSSFIGLGKDSAGERFKSMLIEAAQEAKK
jgi:hypothetical protein